MAEGEEVGAEGAAGKEQQGLREGGCKGGGMEGRGGQWGDWGYGVRGVMGIWCDGGYGGYGAIGVMGGMGAMGSHYGVMLWGVSMGPPHKPTP